MASELKDEIYVLMERGIQPVSAADVASQSAAAGPFPHKDGRPALWSRRTVTIAAAAGCAAVFVAAVFVAAGLVGDGLGTTDRPVRPGSAAKAPVVLTAAMLHHVTSASRLALAEAGRAVVNSRETLGGVLQQTDTDDITFDGRNWNQSFTVATPAADGQPASRESAINRVADGQAYDHFVAADGLAWYHVTGPDAVASLEIPDPRVLLRELAPAARFAKDGTSVLDGVTVTRLTATNTSGLPALNSPGIWPAGTISALTVWVDGKGVVRQVTVTGTQTVRVGMLVSGACAGQKLTQFLARVRDLEKRDHLAPAQAMMREKFSALGKELCKEHLVGPKTEADVTTMTIRFAGIGQPQVIRAPADAIRVYGRG
jgi:hypothetical protein